MDCIYGHLRVLGLINNTHSSTAINTYWNDTTALLVTLGEPGSAGLVPIGDSPADRLPSPGGDLDLMDKPSGDLE